MYITYTKTRILRTQRAHNDYDIQIHISSVETNTYIAIRYVHDTSFTKFHVAIKQCTLFATTNRTLVFTETA